MHTDLQVSAARSVDRVPEVGGVADHGAVDLDPGPVVAQARLLLGLTEREALADLNKNNMFYLTILNTTLFYRQSLIEVSSYLHEYVVAGHVEDCR